MTAEAKTVLGTYDELFVLSDLHLGAKRQHALMNQQTALSKCIDLITQRAKTKKVALCLNGDIIDFLLDDTPHYIRIASATETINAMASGECKAVFAALKKFTAQNNATLLLTLGNHDLELVYRPVRDALIEQIAGSPDAEKRVRWSETGFALTVQHKQEGPKKTVAIVHGNAGDPWNRIESEVRNKVALGGQDAGLGGKPPNDGTRLVVDVLNPLKRRYAFVDLLKPETSAVFPVLLALDGGLAAMGSVFSSAAAAFGGTLHNRLRRFIGVLSSAGSTAAPGPPPSTPATSTRDVDLSEKEIRDAVRYALSFDVPIEAMIPDERSTLGWSDYIAARIAGYSPQQALHAALWEFAQDQRGTFELHTMDSDDRYIDEREDAAYDVVIAGHSHLARFAPRGNLVGRYINTGTWIRLIKITKHLLQPAVFSKLYDRLNSPHLAELDAPIDGTAIILQRYSLGYVGYDKDLAPHDSAALLEYSPQNHRLGAHSTVRDND